MSAVRKFARMPRLDQRGAVAVEYGLIAGILGVSLAASLSALGGGTDGMWTILSTILDGSLL